MYMQNFWYVPNRQDPKISSWWNPVPYFLVNGWIDIKEVVRLVTISFTHKVEPYTGICEMCQIESRNMMQDNQQLQMVFFLFFF